jgi:hypothetical protein
MTRMKPRSDWTPDDEQSVEADIIVTTQNTLFAGTDLERLILTLYGHVFRLVI